MDATYLRLSKNNDENYKVKFIHNLLTLSSQHWSYLWLYDSNIIILDEDVCHNILCSSYSRCDLSIISQISKVLNVNIIESTTARQV